MPRVRKIILPGLLLLLVAAFAGAPFFVKARLQASLAAYGLSDARIGAWKPGPGHISFSEIVLDKSGFNTIGNIKARINWLAPVSGRFFPLLAIDDLALTGEISPQGMLSVGGWMPESIQPSSAIPQTAILNAGRLELYTPAGGLVFNSKGRIEKSDYLAIDIAVWGEQHQLTVDTRWQIAFFGPQKWRAEVEIRDLRLNLDGLQSSRVSGWLTATHTSEDATDALPVLSGQIAAGTFRIGEKTALQNINVTFSGAGEILLTGESGTHKGVQLILDVRNRNGRTLVKASLSGQEIKDILAFLQEFSNDIEAGTGNRVNLMTLLLTPGNLERIEKEVMRTTYDDLEIIIEGEPDDLTGKVIARKMKNGDFITSVISMNPGG